MSFKVRTTKPTSKDKFIKFYNTKASGKGVSLCITGKPTDATCNVLSNCVGYACSRFNEIYCELTGTTALKYATLNCNAEDFVERAKSLGLKTGSTPKPGAIMCWAKGKVGNSSDGAGHVAIVEKVNSASSVMTSESSYGGNAFFNVTRSNSNGNWGISSAYTFRGFIYNPAVKDEVPKTTTTSSSTPKFKVGDIINYVGKVHYISANDTNAKSCVPGKAKITQIYNYGKSKHPYLCIRVSGAGGTVWGWVDESNIQAISTTKTVSKEIKATKAAKSGPDNGIAGKYKVVPTDGLNIRNGASIDEKALGSLPCGTIVTNYGYYTNTGKTMWYYVQAEVNGTKYTGFVRSLYLKKM